MSKNKKKVDLGLIVGWVAPMVITGIERIVDQLENPIAKKSLEMAIKEVKVAVDILTDEDKENGKQFADYYKENWRDKVIDMTDLIQLIVNEKGDNEASKKVEELKGIL